MSALPKPAWYLLSHEQARGCDREVEAAVVRVCEAVWRGRLRALIATGSLVRGETLWRQHSGQRKLLGDAEFIAVCCRPLPANHLQLCREIETQLRDRGLAARIEIQPAPARYLKRLGGQIFSYELRTRGRVLTGDAEVLNLIPAAPVTREDAWRLFAHRLLEWIEAKAQKTEPMDRRYVLCKLYADMATSLLVFAGCYAPSYRERRPALRSWAAQASRDWQPWAERADRALGCKLGDYDITKMEARIWDLHAIPDARQLWSWEIEHLMDLPAGSFHPNKLASWSTRLPWRLKARGWIQYLRACNGLRMEGWRRCWQGRQTTPRYWVYRGLNDWLFGNQAAPWLPMPGLTGKGESAEWERALVENYRRYLVLSRA